MSYHLSNNMRLPGNEADSETAKKNKSILTWKFFFNALTLLYALVLTIVSVIFELSPTWQDELWLAQIIYHLFMYGSGILVLLYFYAYMIYPQCLNFILTKIIRKPEWEIQQTSYSGEGAGTLYLRMGALCFGTLGIVLYGMEIYLSYHDNDEDEAIFSSEHISAMVFTFIQMHFIFCHSKIRLTGSSKMAKFGMMHLVAVNLWTWLRYITEYEISHIHHKITLKANNETESEEKESAEEAGHVSSLTTGVRVPIQVQWSDVSTGFADLTTFFITCIVEYSLIAAAVMFVMWSTIDHHVDEGSPRVERKGLMRIDCSRTSRGLFAGVFYMIISFVAIGIYGIDATVGNAQTTKVFEIINIPLFVIVLLACLLACWRIRLLQYRLHPRGEVIDEILLCVGLVGELIYCFIGIDLFITDIKHDHLHENYLTLFCFISRAVETMVQTVFIVTVSRLRCYSKLAMATKPGKQIVTFLLVANISLFILQTFENMTSNLLIDPTTSSSAYLTIISIVSPLLVFYRFHSSVCLAEAWKRTYDDKAASRSTSTTASLMTEATWEPPKVDPHVYA